MYVQRRLLDTDSHQIEDLVQIPKRLFVNLYMYVQRRLLDTDSHQIEDLVQIHIF